MSEALTESNVDAHEGEVIVKFFFFFFQAEDGIRDVERSRGLGDVYKRQDRTTRVSASLATSFAAWI